MRKPFLAALLLAATSGLFYAPAAAAGRHDSWPLHLGSAGPRVKAAQYLLHRSKVVAPRRGFAVHTLQNRPSGWYGPATVQAARDAKWTLGWPVTHIKSRDGGKVGPYFFNVLQGKAARPLPFRIAAGKRAWRRTHKPVYSLSTRQKRVAATGRYLANHGPLIHYSQSLRFTIMRWGLHPPPLTRNVYEDCSSFATTLLWLSRFPDPNGNGWAGGFTGTLAIHGRQVWHQGQPLSQFRVGDVVIYGYSYPYVHAAVYIGGGRVVSQGSEGGPYLLPVLYRPDAHFARRYIR
jgi:cell wall-associated NlpC family hydrolase